MPRPPAPKIDHPYVFSVSQIETFELCPRKWGFEKIDGLEREDTKFTLLGREVHDILELYLEKAIDIDTDTIPGRIAKPGIKYLPFPKTPGMRVEKWFAIQFGVAAYRGLKDVEIIQAQRKRPLVLDHKTTRSWTWKKSKEELLHDTQAGIYAADAMVKTGASEVDLRWVYYKTEGKPDSEPVDAVINRSQVSEILTRTDQTARRIIKVLQTARRAMDIEPDYSGCSKYGGCPRRETHCKPKPVQVLKAIMTQKVEEDRRERSKAGSSTSAFLADLKGRKDKKSGGSKARDPEPIEVEDVDPINSPDREEFEQPPPPPAKKVNGQWVNPEWDDADAEWKFPEGVEASEKAAKATSKAAEKAAGKKGTTTAKSSGKGARDILAEMKSKKKDAAKVVERIADPEEEEEEEEGRSEEVVSETPIASKRSREIHVLAELLDLLVEKVAEKVMASKIAEKLKR